jgi:type VI secretion system protein ImpG
MFPKYFQQEMSNLKELGAEFSRAHPALAPMLSGAPADPDVERLLEGTAFLTALIRQKMDDEFPEIVHDLLQIVAPHYLNPIPSATIFAFRPKPTLRETARLPAGISGASIPVEGTSCLFRTCYPVELHPLQILDASVTRPPGRPPFIRVALEWTGAALAQWNPNALRFYLADEFGKASDLHCLLSRHLRNIRIVGEDANASCVLDKSHLKSVGFDSAEGLVPYPSNAFPGFSLLQDYFLLPQKFLFFDLTGWNEWRARGAGRRFEIQFELDDPPFMPERISRDSFVLHATPAINLFPHEAEPVDLDHTKEQYPVRASGNRPEHHPIFAVREVKAFVQGTSEEKNYAPFDFLRPGLQSQPVYHLSRRAGALHDGADVFLSVAYPPGAALPSRETLSLRLLCTNGNLPARLRQGDISTHAAGCPEYVTFENIIPPTSGMPSPVGKNILWRLLSHLALGFQSLEKLETLKSLLALYVFTEPGDPATLAHQKRIESLQALTTHPADRLVSGYVMRGRELVLELRGNHFTGPGDLVLFGSVLDIFLGNYASINSFTTLSLKDTTGGRRYQWPARTGDQCLI